MEDVVKNFTQSPNIILYGLPEISIQDKWALLALMGMCWDRNKSKKTLPELEGPYNLTLREIEAITGVKYSVLRDRQGKEPREGVLERWQKYGYITIVDETLTNEETGKTSKKKTYLYIHLTKIWNDNTQFNNRIPGKLVSAANINQSHDVSEANKYVAHANKHFSKANKYVSGSRSKGTPINTYKDISNTNNTGDQFSDERNGGNGQPQPLMLGFAKMAMRDCLQYCGKSISDTHILTRVDSLFQRSGLDKQDFRVKVDSVLNDLRASGNRDIEVFLRRLEKTTSVERNIAVEA